MSSITKPIAQVLAYRWGHLDEEPPEFIDDLMVDLTRALAAAEQEGDRTRAECLDEVLDALAEGIVLHERPSADEVDPTTLDAAISEIRRYYYQESDVSPPGAERVRAASPCPSDSSRKQLPSRPARGARGASAV